MLTEVFRDVTGRIRNRGTQNSRRLHQQTQCRYESFREVQNSTDGRETSRSSLHSDPRTTGKGTGMAVELTATEQRWETTRNMLNCLIDFLRQGKTREEWILLAILLSVKGSTLNPYSLERLRTVMEKYTEQELTILKAPNN